jgi:hypothetical protein
MHVYADHDSATANFFHGDYWCLQAAGTNLVSLLAALTRVSGRDRGAPMPPVHNAR